VLLALLVYGYATGVFSRRKPERATDDAVAFRFLAAHSHPDHDTLATCRQRFLPELAAWFVHVLSIAQTMPLRHLGQLTRDGSKRQAYAAKHKALSHGHLEKRAAQRRDEVRALLATAAIAARATARFDAAQPHAAAHVARREAPRHAGQPPRGQEPPPAAGPRAQDQVNRTDAASRIRPVAAGGFAPAYNVQAAVDAETMRVRVTGVTPQTHDKPQVAAMLAALAALAALPDSLGQVDSAAMDNGYGSAANVKTGRDRDLAPLIAVGRDAHHLPAAAAPRRRPRPTRQSSGWPGG
jgi:hypothetical protein